MRGFTLIEIVVSTFILSLLIAGIFTVLYLGDLSWRQDLALLDLQQGSRLVMEGMSRELRGGKPSSISITLEGKKITFSIKGLSQPISYYLNDDNQIVREYPPNTTKIIANNIENLDFCCLGGSDCYDCSHAHSVKIKLKAHKKVKQKDIWFPFQDKFLIQKVRLRND
jgi:prepilin-type N-terminal cleavage/methylation domain-containing protein